ncbi:MAG: MFS transporter, partial [Candidatus Thorarchaeota archaeon]
MATDVVCEADYAERYRILTALSYILFAMGPLVGNAVLTLLGAISSDFMTNPTAVLIAIPAFMFPFAIIQLFSGALSDMYGRIPVIVVGLVGFSIGLLLTAVSQTVETFALGNFLSGVGFGFVNPVLLALLSDCAPPQDIPKRMGIASALGSLSVGLGPFIAGQMLVLGWSSYYIMFVFVAIIGLVAISIAVRPPVHNIERAGVRVLLHNLRLELKRPVVMVLLASSFFVALTYLGTLIWTSRGLTGSLDEGLIGIILLGGGIVGSILGFLLGAIIRRFGLRVPFIMAMLSLFTGLVILISIEDLTSFGSLFPLQAGIIFVAGAGGLLLPLMITYSQILSPERRGVLAGIVTFGFFLGSALIPMIYEPFFILSM